MSEARDDELEAYLDGRSPLSRRYAELGDEQPPAELDARILAAAARAAKVVPLERPTRRWGAALAVAATLVLCVSLVMNLTITPEGPLGDDSPAAVEFAEPDPLSRSRPAPAASAADESRAEFNALRRQAVPGAAPDRETSMNDSFVAGPSQGTGRLELSAPAETRRRPEVAAPALGEAGAKANLAVEQSAARESPAPDSLLAAIQLVRAFVSEPADAATAAKSEATLQSRPESGVASRSQQKDGSAGSDAQRLREIIGAFDAGDRARAATLLDQFVAEFPDHPLSRQLAERP
jgi:hypothetical protein